MTDFEYLISDPAGRPSIRTNNPDKVRLMLDQGWTAVRFVFGSPQPVNL